MPERMTRMSASTSQSVRDAITEANRKFMAAVQARDAAGLARLFTADASLLPPNGDFISGAQAIQAFYEAALGLGIRSNDIETLEVEFHGDTAIEMGNYKLYGGDGGVLDHGKYIVIWKHHGERWLLHRDIWNSSRALA
jgi:uncharacterized protein (TIGR02246 family)